MWHLCVFEKDLRFLFLKHEQLYYEGLVIVMLFQKVGSKIMLSSKIPSWTASHASFADTISECLAVSSVNVLNVNK